MTLHVQNNHACGEPIPRSRLALEHFTGVNIYSRGELAKENSAVWEHGSGSGGWENTRCCWVRAYRDT